MTQTPFPYCFQSQKRRMTGKRFRCGGQTKLYDIHIQCTFSLAAKCVAASVFWCCCGEPQRTSDGSCSAPRIRQAMYANAAAQQLSEVLIPSSNIIFQFYNALSPPSRGIQYSAVASSVGYVLIYTGGVGPYTSRSYGSVWFGTTSIPVFNTAVGSVRSQYRYPTVR